MDYVIHTPPATSTPHTPHLQRKTTVDINPTCNSDDDCGSGGEKGDGDGGGVED
ncbi:hypothetical protein Hanom_Chr14g01272681 [Helianthus anomalus]